MISLNFCIKATAILGWISFVLSENNKGFNIIIGKSKSSESEPVREAGLQSNLAKNNFSDMPKITAHFMDNGSTLQYVKKSTTGVSWHGEVEGQLGEMNIIYNPKRKTITGSAYTKDMVYNFNTISRGQVKVTEIRHSDHPPEAKPLTLSKEIGENIEKRNRLGNHVQQSNGRPQKESGEVIDVMVPYTKHAMCAEAFNGKKTTCDYNIYNRRPIENRIKLAIEEANYILELSGIKTQFRLVHTYLAVDYDDSGSTFADAKRALSELRTDKDGVLDEVHSKRKRYGADLVQLWVNNGSGLAYRFEATPETGFSVVNRIFATGSYSMAHELGHNLGALHDQKAMGCYPVCPGYNYGWKSEESSMRTIMSYRCKNKDCPKIQRFSNIKKRFKDVYVGSETENNARVIEDNKAVVANYFAPSAPCTSDQECSDDDINNGNEFCEDGVCYGGYPVQW